MTTKEPKTTDSKERITTEEPETTISQLKTTENLACHIAPDHRQVELPDVEVHGTSVKVTWNHDESAHKYEVCCWTNEHDRRATQTRSMSYTFSNLKCGETYFANVTHIDKDGNYSSMPSATVEFCTDPKPPTNLQAEIYEAKPQECIIVSFEDNNEWVVEHEVTITSIDERETQTKTTANRRVLFTDLKPGQSYMFSAVTIHENKKEGDQTTHPKSPVGNRTGSDAGQTSSRSQSEQTPILQKSKRVYGDHIVTTYPRDPEEVRRNPDTDERLEIIWNEPVIKPLKYHIYWEANDEKHENDYSTMNSFNITNLKPSTTYRYKVASINSAGKSNFSKEGKYVTAPAAPVNVVAVKNPHNRETSFIVTFEDPDPTPKKYMVTAEPMDESRNTVVETESHTAVLNDLDPGRPYFIYVVAISLIDEEKRSVKAYFKKER